MRVRNTIRTGALIALAAMAVGCDTAAESDESVRDENDAIVESGEVGVFSMQLGDCLENMGVGDGIESAVGVPCSSPHESEVYYSFNLEGDEFPGEDEVGIASDEGCFDAFEPFVGAPYETSIFDIITLNPTKDSWELGDDREVLCLLIRVDGEMMEGSAEGAAQ